MKPTNRTRHTCPPLALLGMLLGLGLLGWAVVLPLLAQAGPSTLPPRPTLTPTFTPAIPPTPTETPPPTAPRTPRPTEVPVVPPTAVPTSPTEPPPPVVLPQTGRPASGFWLWLLAGGGALLAGGAALWAGRRQRGPGRR